MTERQAWQQHHRKQAAYEIAWRGRIFRALRRQKKPFIDYVKNATEIATFQPTAAELQAVLNTLITDDELTKVLNRLYLEIMPKEAAEYWRDNANIKAETMLGFGQSVQWLDDVQTFLRGWLGAQITRMTQYTKRLMLAYISEGLQNGDSYDQIIKRMEATGIDKVRAANIARTETNRASNVGKYLAIGKLPYAANVIWVAARDSRTRGFKPEDRSDHFQMNGQVRPYGVPFTDPRNGDQLLYPGDVSHGAGAESICNCRCVCISKRIR